MTDATLEHLNVTVRDPQKMAALLCNLFDWNIRWQGDAIDGGHSIHVGARDTYLALYAGIPTDNQPATSETGSSYKTVNGLNHIGIVVDDLDSAEKRVVAAGFRPHSHADYEPGKRFYFHDKDGLEFEVISY